MKTTNTNRAALMAAVALGALAGAALPGNQLARASTEATQTQTSTTVQQVDRSSQAPSDSKTSQLTRSGWIRLRRSERRSGLGWTNAHQKRVARKARNVKRHRKSLKG